MCRVPHQTASEDVPGQHGQWSIRNVTLDACPIPHVPLLQPGDTTRYLGASVDPWSGITIRDSVSQLSSWIEQIDSYPLKPRQRLERLVTYAEGDVRFNSRRSRCQSSVGWTRYWLEQLNGGSTFTQVQRITCCTRHAEMEASVCLDLKRKYR